MAICPVCHKNFARRKKGKCPGCGASIIIYEGEWIEEGQDSPPARLLKAFETAISETQSIGRKYPVVWKTPKPRQQEYLARMKRLWEDADRDIYLALEAMDIIRHSKQFSGFPSSIGLLEYHWSLAVSIARSRMKERQEEKKKRAENLDRIMGREDIFE